MVDSLLGPKSARPGRLAGRLTRSILLGAVAAGFALYWLADSYGVDPRELVENLQTSLVFVAVFILAGLVGGAILWLLRRFKNSRAR